MVFHIRKQLRHAIAAALAPAATHVFPGRTWPTEKRHYPAIFVYARGGSSRFDSMAATDTEIPLEREEQVVDEGVVKMHALDDLAAAIEPLMMTDPGIAALVDRRELVATAIEARSVADGREGSIKLTYRVVFSTAAGLPTAKI